MALESTKNPNPISGFFRALRSDIRFRLINLHIFLAIVVVTLALLFSDYARNRLELDIQRTDIALAQALALEIDQEGQSLGDASQNIVSWMRKVWGDQVAVVTVVDQNGQNIMQLKGGTSLLEDNDWESWSSWQRKVTQTTLQGNVGSFFSEAPNGEGWMHSYVTTPSSGARVIIQRPTNEAFSTLQLIFGLMATALLLYVAAIVAFWYRLSSTIISPLQILESFSAKITGREISTLEGETDLEQLSMRSDQVGLLANALSEMGNQYLITDDQLDRQTGRLEAILESMEAGLILENLQGTILYCNRQASDWLGLKGREITGKKASAELIKLAHSKDNRALVTFLNNNDEDMLELSRLRSDGKVQYLNLNRFKVLDSKGKQIGSGQIWQDVSSYREMDRMKSALISTVSHELRTPLTSIIGYSDSLMAQDVEWDEAKKERFIWRINSESRRLKTLIERLLNFTRMEGGRLEIMMRPCDLNDIVIEVIDSMEMKDAIRFELDLHNKLPQVNGDKERLATVIRNLMENALKYGPPDMKILVSTESDREKGSVIFSVKDGGTTLKGHNTNRIFEPFYRLDSAYNRSSSGVGLGLAICQGFIAAHGGDIWFEATDVGTTFCFALTAHSLKQAKQST